MNLMTFPSLKKSCTDPIRLPLPGRCATELGTVGCPRCLGLNEQDPAEIHEALCTIGISSIATCADY